MFSLFFLLPFFGILMLNYFIERGHHQNDRNGQPLTFFYKIMHEIYGGRVRFAPPERKLVL